MADRPMYAQAGLADLRGRSTLGPIEPPPPQPTILADLQNQLNQRILRLDVLCEGLEAVIERIVGPRPATPTGTNTREGGEANPGGFGSALQAQANTLGYQLDRFQAALEVLNKVA